MDSKIVNTLKSRCIFYGIKSSVTSIAYSNVLPDVIWTHTLNPPVWCDITYLHIFEIFNLFIPFSISIDSPFVFCGTPCRLVWFVFVGIGGHLGSSRWWRIEFRHVAPWRMHVTPNGIFFNTSSCKDPPVGFWLPSSVMSIVVCFKGCIFRWMVKSLGVWDTTYPFTLGLSPGFSFYTSSVTLLSAHILQLVIGCQGLWWMRLCVSRGASPDVQWSPLVFGKWHIHSHPDFPQELRSTASSISRLPARIKQFVLGCQGLWVGIGVLKSTWGELLWSLLMFWAIIRFMGKM